MFLSLVKSGEPVRKSKFALTIGVGRWFVCCVAVAASFGICEAGRGQTSTATSPLSLKTSDAQLQRSFDWAKQQALAYVGSGHDAVKDWYEAALPGRHAFCMRDVSHQAAGAAALGLQAQNKSMLDAIRQGHLGLKGLGELLGDRPGRQTVTRGLRERRGFLV